LAFFVVLSAIRIAQTWAYVRGLHHAGLARGRHQPRPARHRILIGGSGERRTLPLVARYADACNLPDIPDGGVTLRRKMDVLARACEEIGRPFDEIEKTVATAIGADEPAGAFAERCSKLAEMGLGHATVISRGPWTDDAVARVAEGARQLA
jgi:alkanesulfonate monooxygenase SsuD/methylene tetrahydromethanopterin reductase-like flavin-dependent oxidoreductase (luciferase family)